MQAPEFTDPKSIPPEVGAVQAGDRCAAGDHWPPNAEGVCGWCRKLIAYPVMLMPDQRGVMLGLIRDAARKVSRNRQQGRRKWGDDYDDRPAQEREAILAAMYVLLGMPAVSIHDRCREDYEPAPEDRTS